jgi:hypothetical protein
MIELRIVFERTFLEGESCCVRLCRRRRTVRAAVQAGIFQSTLWLLLLALCCAMLVKIPVGLRRRHFICLKWPLYRMADY